MSKYFSFCNGKKQKEKISQSKNKKSLAKTMKLYMRLFLLFLIFSLAIGYVLLTNFSTTKGFEISQLEKQLNLKKQQYKQLEDQAGELKSLELVEQKACEIDMVSVAEVEYLSITGGVAVMK